MGGSWKGGAEEEWQAASMINDRPIRSGDEAKNGSGPLCPFALYSRARNNQLPTPSFTISWVIERKSHKNSTYSLYLFDSRGRFHGSLNSTDWLQFYSEASWDWHIHIHSSAG